MVPGSYGLFYLGEVIDLYRMEQLFYWERYLKYGSPFKTQFLGDKTVVFSEPEAYKKILIDNAECFSSNIGWKVLEVYFGRGILLEDSQFHLFLRKFLNPSFHKSAVKSYVEIINSCANETLDHAKSSMNSNLYDLLRRFTLKVIICIVFGSISTEKSSYIQDQFEKILLGLRDWQRIPLAFTAYGRSFQAITNLEALILSELKNTVNANDFNSTKLISILSKLYNENALTKLKVVEIILQIFFAGHETTSNLLISSINVINSYPKIKNTLLEEISNVSVSNMSHLSSLPYLNAFILEVQRLFPPVFYIPRGVKEDIDICGIILSKGSLVHLCPLITHRNPDYYSNPNIFYPERFLSTNTYNKADKFTFANFGAGDHYCLGAELSIIEVKIFLHYFLMSSWSVSPFHATTEVENFNSISRLFEVQIH